MRSAALGNLDSPILLKGIHSVKNGLSPIMREFKQSEVNLLQGPLRASSVTQQAGRRMSALKFPLFCAAVKGDRGRSGAIAQIQTTVLTTGTKDTRPAGHAAKALLFARQ